MAAQPLAEMPFGRTIALHLLPGVLMTVVDIALAPLVMAHGFPGVVGLLLATVLVLIPFELGYLLWQGRRRNATASFEGVVTFREPLPTSQYVIWTLVFFAWGIASSALASPVESALRNGLFSWLPSWFAPTSLADYAAYSRSALAVSFWLGLIVVGFLGPIVEELYFRGHLLPRLGRLGAWAPLLNATLFSAYHLWTPWQNPSRILLMVPLTYLVWRKRNIYLAMLAHCVLNAIVWTITFGAILRAHR
jgi:membrane protease YdiL (CAAX protease family)